MISENRARYETLLESFIQNTDIPAPRLKEAILYSLFPGGKRLRPMLVYLTGELVNANAHCLDSIALAIEFIHTYSLVHDDLPAMDDDDLRRGKPSCHMAFDEATAILVGDALQALATDHLLTELPKTLPNPQVIDVTQKLVHAIGLSGMVSGQSLDLSELSKLNVKESQLHHIHQLKTGKLILAAINMVLAAAHPTREAVDALNTFGIHLGLVFQMQDDFLDRYSADILGKHCGSDIANQKTTFATLYSKNALSSLIADEYKNTKIALSFFGKSANDLLHLVEEMHQRMNEDTS